jgi:hypothetical protein
LLLHVFYFEGELLMEERIGYIGRYKGHKVFFDGLFYTTEINGKTFVIDESKADADIERWTPGC